MFETIIVFVIYSIAAFFSLSFNTVQQDVSMSVKNRFGFPPRGLTNSIMHKITVVFIFIFPFYYSYKKSWYYLIIFFVLGFVFRVACSTVEHRYRKYGLEVSYRIASIGYWVVTICLSIIVNFILFNI